MAIKWAGWWHVCFEGQVDWGYRCWCCHDNISIRIEQWRIMKKVGNYWKMPRVSWQGSRPQGHLEGLRQQREEEERKSHLSFVIKWRERERERDRGEDDRRWRKLTAPSKRGATIQSAPKWKVTFFFPSLSLSLSLSLSIYLSFYLSFFSNPRKSKKVANCTTCLIFSSGLAFSAARPPSTDSVISGPIQKSYYFFCEIKSTPTIDSIRQTPSK